MSFLPLNEPIIGQPEKDSLMAAIDSGFVSSAGPAVSEFESSVAKWIGSEHAVAVSSGTAALHLALLGVGVEPGDQVAVSDLTFIASANAASYCGAELLFVGPDRSTWNMDTELLHDHIRKQASSGRRIPAAIEVVHILGHPVFWEPLEQISSEFEIPIVEDAAEAMGARVRTTAGWRQCGTLSQVGCLSFNGNKLITTGGGGMLITDDADLASRARHLSTQARLPGAAYSHDAAGFNYRMPALSAALGSAQLTRVDGFLKEKQRIRNFYEALFVDTQVTLAPVADWAEPSHWLVSASLSCSEEERDRVVAECNRHGVGIRPIWRPLHLQQPYTGAEQLSCDASMSVYSDGVSLPSTPSLMPEDLSRAASTLLDALAKD